MTRRLVIVVATGSVVVSLLASSSARIVGDGAEYVAMALNFAALRGPSIAPADVDGLQRAIASLDSRFTGWDIRGSTVASRDRRRDFAHFWFYPLVAAPFVWAARLAGVSPLAAFTAVNVGVLMAALWCAVPRIGAAAAVLLFVSPVLWWIDKPHTEVFTFALLAIAFLTMRDRPWWSMAASGLAATQNPPIAIVTLLTAAGHLIGDRGAYRDRRFLAGAAAGGALCVIQPLYTYLRHGTPSLLTLQNPGHAPSWAEIAAVPFDPAIGLAAHFPGLVVAVMVALPLVLRAGRPAVRRDEWTAAAAAAGFLFAFSQATNVHHGGTPGFSRYAVWLMPLAIPLFARANERSAQRWMWPIAVASGIASALLYGPSVPENAREPGPLAAYLWTRHPGWNNPLPEVFAEVSAHQDARSAPTWTRGCEKVLLMGRGTDAPFPIPCAPAAAPGECLREGALCYANRDGRRYRFVRAPGSAVAWSGFTFEPDRVWPPGSAPGVRDLLEQAQWWTLNVRSGGDAALRMAHGVRVTELHGPSRLVFILRDIRPDAEIVVRVPSGMRGTLTDASTRRRISEVSYAGPPLEPWRIAVPSGSSLLILTLSMS
ncbi:MAG TPA: hypothetical protein VFK57_15980 [Vicinamibacterales bacterium]|nr:hypothetical protein [Vicinamibacterales bacterium]